MQLLVSDIINLTGSDAFGTPGAIRELHGVSKPLRKADGEIILTDKGHAQMEMVPYEFTPGTRMKLALVMSKLFPLAQAFEEERKDLVKTYRAKARAAKVEDATLSGDLDEKSPVWHEFSEKLTALLKQPSEDIPRMPKLKDSDLKADQNKIPSTVLAALFPILEQPQE